MTEAVREAGGVVGAGAPLTHAAPPIASPFGTAELVEHERLEAVAVSSAELAPAGTAFLDGIQRYAVEGRFGLVPVVRGYAAAAVLRRAGTALRSALHATDEFLAVPVHRLTADQRTALDRVGVEIVDVEAAERSHPILDVQLAAKVVERRRERLERRLALEYLERDTDGWLVVDGALSALVDGPTAVPKLVGLIKSHETQFLDGRDLEVALTLPAGHRTSVFRRTWGERAAVYTWYLRVWPWEQHDVLHGLVRLERPPGAAAVADATTVSRWILAERVPLAAPDSRWDRLIYPIQQVETYLRAHAGGWW